MPPPSSASSARSMLAKWRDDAATFSLRARMTRSAAIARAAAFYDRGGFAAELARRVAFRTESQNPGSSGRV